MEARDQVRLWEGLWGCLEWRMKGGRKGPPALGGTPAGPPRKKRTLRTEDLGHT